jgi:hypothetical protein
VQSCLLNVLYRIRVEAVIATHSVLVVIAAALLAVIVIVVVAAGAVPTGAVPTVCGCS